MKNGKWKRGRTKLIIDALIIMNALVSQSFAFPVIVVSSNSNYKNTF